MTAVHPDIEMRGDELYAEHSGNDDHVAPAHEFATLMPITADELVGVEVGALEPGEVGYIATCSCGFSTRVRYAAVVARSVVQSHVVDEYWKAQGLPLDAPVCFSGLMRDVVR